MIETTSNSHQSNHCLHSSLSKLIFGVFGIYATFFVSSVVHQKMYPSSIYPYLHNASLTIPYEQVGTHNKDKFTFPVLLLILPSFIGWTVSGIYNRITRASTPIRQINAIKIALCYVVSLSTFNQAIVMINYPLVVLVKSCNIMSVILIGVFCSNVTDENNRLGKQKLVIGALMCLGVFVFSKSGETAEGGNPVYQNLTGGLIFLVFSLLADGLMSDLQAEVKTKFKPRPLQIYQKVNFWIFALSSTYTISSSQVNPIATFISKHPQVMLDAMTEAVLNCIGQMFVYYLINHFRQHIVPLIITIRKILSGLISIVVFKHDVNFRQCLGLSLVILAVLLEISSKWIVDKWKKYLQARKYTII